MVDTVIMFYMNVTVFLCYYILNRVLNHDRCDNRKKKSLKFRSAIAELFR